MTLLRRIHQKLSHASLTFRLAFAVSVLLFLIGVFGTYVLAELKKRAIAETSVTDALYHSEMLKLKLLESMMNQTSQHEELSRMLTSENMRNWAGEANVFGSKGEVRYSNKAANIGKTISDIPPDAWKTPDDALIQFTDMSSHGNLRILHTIKGSEHCATCHVSSKGAPIGGVELLVPLSPIYKRFAVNRLHFFLAGFLVIGAGISVVYWLVRRIVNEPIRKLTALMEKAEAGELDVRAPAFQEPSFRALAEKFNSMVCGIQLAQKALEQEHQKQLSQANRLSSLGYLISNVSHEIKNPLASISSTLHALRHEFEAVDGQEIFEEITAHISRIERTVNNLLRYARRAPARFEICPLAEPVHNALTLAEPALNARRIKIDLSPGSEEINVYADGGQLQQIFLNLFLNAASAMPQGGKLSVRIWSEEIAAGQEMRRSHCVSVRDTGAGIPPENLSKIFDPFFTTSENGTGLGLSVVREIVDSHKGEIKVESTLNKGSCFTVRLPAFSEEAPAPDDARLQKMVPNL